MTININKSININGGTTHNLLCRDAYCSLIKSEVNFPFFKEYNGCHVRKCRNTEDKCRGAHDERKIKKLQHIIKYDNMDKSKYNWVKLYIDIIETIKRENNKIKIDMYKNKINNIDRLNFIELIQLWRELACYYRKIAKDKSMQDVPTFYLSENYEDVSWTFERITRKCPIYEKFMKSLENKEQITIWDVCLGTGINCKEGIHNDNEMLCIDDFLTGNCECNKTDTINKKIHYTEYGMLPFDIQYQNYLLENENSKKEWDRDIIEEQVKKPVIKIGKIGKK